MRRRIQLAIVLFAWLFATGSQWDLVQTFAWGRMIASYSRTMPLVQAVRMTFQPDRLCSICKMVGKAKQQQSGSAPGGAAVSKMLLVFQPAPVVVVAPPPVSPWSVDEPASADVGRSAPLLQPPRSAVA